MKYSSVILMFLVTLSALAKPQKLPMTRDAAKELVQLLSQVSEKITNEPFYNGTTTIQVSELTMSTPVRVSINLLLDKYFVDGDFTEQQIRKIGQYVGVRTLPSFNRLAPESRRKSLNQILSSYTRLPLNVVLMLKASGKGIDVVADSVIEHPVMKAFANETPRGWTAGRTWAESPGVGARRDHPTIIAGNSLNKVHASADLVLHEVGHSIDRFFMNSGNAMDYSTKQAFIEIHDNTPFLELFHKNVSYFENIEENFAEMLALYFRDFTSREEMKRVYPEAYSYFESKFSN